MRGIDSSNVKPIYQHERALIEQLIAATKLYNSSEAIQELFDFTIRLREFAPFNAMLLHIQKPGLTHAATARDWWSRFRRKPKTGARPLLILRVMGPVDFVFDIQDTEGDELPEGAFAFPTFGDLTEERFSGFMPAIARERIEVVEIDAGDGHAGWIRLIEESTTRRGKNRYKLAYNRNHPVATRFVTVAHELAHLYLGHMGPDGGRRVPDRGYLFRDMREVEAEMTAYLVAKRNGLEPKSESYLANYQGAFRELDLYAVTRAANAVETAMGISAQKLWNEKGSGP
ncbi:MAG: ImmA/IrrE family metallo-endopeptidase [Bryobacterales bacterium]|nr:ImmA/IrrE family metallo-endopeptidase [Bryobacterales bacterium]